MNLTDSKYNRFALVKEMMETPGVISGFDSTVLLPFAEAVRKKGGIFLTGEGSSRIFPAKRAMYARMIRGCRFPVMTEGSTQAIEYDLKTMRSSVPQTPARPKRSCVSWSALRDRGMTRCSD